MNYTDLKTDVSPSGRYVRILITRDKDDGQHVLYDSRIDGMHDLQTGKRESEWDEHFSYIKMLRAIARHEIDLYEATRPDGDWFGMIPGTETISITL